ncbi:MAG: hypothetical protein ACLVL7_08975 [Anaerotruncus massiliensis (ex Togo et al. 2019)]
MLYGRRQPPADGPCVLKDRPCNDVFLLKLIPGTNPRVLTACSASNTGAWCRGVRRGGSISSGATSAECAAPENGVSVVVCSQCL